MPKYLSGRVKRTPQGFLSTDRYQYLGLEQAEPNLGDPANPLPDVPEGQQFQIISLRDKPGERFWIPLTGGVQPGSITVRDEGSVIPNGSGINSITDVNFVGSVVNVSGSLDDNGNPGVAVTVTISPTGNDNEILFNDNGDFGTSSIFTFDNSTVGVASVGIGTSQPTQNLHIVGNLRLENAFFDEENQSGDQGDLLVKTASGGLKYTPAGSVTSGAGGTITEIQFHDSTGLVNGAENFVFDFTNKRVGIGSTQPDRLLDVLGNSRFAGITTITGETLFAKQLNVAGVSTFNGLTVKQTEPILNITRNFGSSTAMMGVIVFGNSNIDSNLARIEAVGDGATDSAALTFHTQATGNITRERLRITSDGKVGINTATPTANFEVTGNPGTATTIFINSSDPASTVAAEAVLKFGFGHSGNPDAVSEIKLVEGSTNSFGGDLTFSVPSNDGLGGSTTSEALRITSGGNVSLGTQVSNERVNIHTASSLKAQVQFTNTTTGTAAGDGLVFGITGGEDAIIWNQENTDTIFATNNLERLRITSDGLVGIGTTDITSKLTIASDNNDNPIETIRYNEGVDGATLFLQHSRSNDIGTKVQLNDNDEVGNIEFRSFASDNSTIVRAARIFAEADGTADTTDVPAALVFSTNSKTGAGTAEERLRIDSSGHLLRGGSDQNIGASNATWNKVYAQEFIGQINTIQENLEINNLNVNGISTFVGLSTFNNGIIVESGISTFKDSVGIGTIPASGTSLDIDATGGGVLALRRNSVNTSNKITLSHDGTDGTLESTNDVIFRAGGDERFRITSDGKVGIGTDLTTTPSSTLTVSPHNSTSGRNISIYTSGAVGNKAGIFFNSTSGTGNLAEIQAEYKGTNEGELVFSTSMSKRITIQKGGNVGIGTDSPQTILHLHDSTNTRIQFTDDAMGAASGDGVIVGLNGDDDFFINNRESGKGIKFFTGSDNERLHITSGGNLNQTIGADAIGFNQTASGNHNIKNVANSNRTGANAILLALHSQWNSTDVAAIKFRSGTDTSNKDDGYITFETSSANNITERLRITSTGEVNIGGDYDQTTYKMKVTGTVAATNFDSLSDQKLKINIRKIESPIETVNKIDGVTFDWKEDNSPSMGVIAQNVEKVLPEIVSGDDTKSVNYSGLIGLLIEVVKDQQKQINELRDRLDK